MNKDLLIIKKKYGEEMAHFCREHLATLLETEGLLSSIIFEHFDVSHELYHDLKENCLFVSFIKYIYSFTEEAEENVKTDKTPQELLESVGYQLYECKTESDIQSFKKYCAPGEELCTFRGGRLETHYVFFAVKKNVDTIKREDFKNPKRQDDYGISVISIQFSRKTNQVSIKNRYNHIVQNPDSTFGNNLDNIVVGLTDAFERVYGFKQENIQKFEIPNYVMMNGKYYKYNYEINYNHYCTNNIFIKNNEIISYPKERYILFDYYLLDIKEKKIQLLDDSLKDDFIDTIGHIQKIQIEIEAENKKIKIINNVGYIIEIIINKNNQMISYRNNGIKEIGFNFCYYNKTIEEIYLPEVEIIGETFCYSNQVLSLFCAPNLEKVDSCFCFSNRMLTNLSLPKLKMIGKHFCCNNVKMKKIDFPNVRSIDYGFCHDNKLIEKLDFPNVEIIGDDFCFCNNDLTVFNAPNLKRVGDSFFCQNVKIEKLSLPKVKTIGDDFLFYNKSLKELNLPDVETIGNEFCRRNIVLTELQLPKVKNIGHYFCSQNSSIIKFNAPNLENVGVEFLKYHVHLKSLIIPKIKNIESIVCLLYSKISLDVLILNDELMNSNYPLVLSYKKNLLLEEKTNKTVSSNNSLSLALKEIKNNIHN